MSDRKRWTEIAPEDAVDLILPHPDIIGPANEAGEPCPWPWGPIQLVGVPLGMHHCEYCGAMVIAGMHHIDYKNLDEDLAEYVRQHEMDK